MESKNIKVICKSISDKKGVKIRVFDVEKLTSLAYDFVVASTRSKRQSKACADEVISNMKKLGTAPLRVEGYNEGEWVLIDYGDILVHIFMDDIRTRYEFDDLWKDADITEFHDDDDEAADLDGKETN